MPDFPKSTLILGGASSGKSAFAEALVKSAGGVRVYLATTETGGGEGNRDSDAEMAAKIQRHRAQRGQGWQTVEEPLEVAARLNQCDPGRTILLDCATLWLSNQFSAGRDIPTEQARLIKALNACPAPVVTVSNEVGHGIVPINALSRAFRDAQGRLNIALAAQADLVVLVTAGLPQVLKGRLPR